MKTVVSQYIGSGQKEFMMLETERLILRQWQQKDEQAFIQMGLDAVVMRYFPRLLTAAESLNLIRTVSAIIEKNGWGVWAVELKENQAFIGFIGLHDQQELFSFSPCVEIAWRLAKEH